MSILIINVNSYCYTVIHLPHYKAPYLSFVRLPPYLILNIPGNRFSLLKTLTYPVLSPVIRTEQDFDI